MVEGRYQLQAAATTGNGTSVDVGGAGREHSFYLTPAGTISAGAVVLETAPSASYSGTWSPIAGPIVLATGVCQQIAYTGCLLAVRARISTNVTGAGGSVTVDYVSN